MAYTKCMITCMLHFRESYPESCPRIIPANHTTNHTHDFNNIGRNIPRNIPPKHTSETYLESYPLMQHALLGTEFSERAIYIYIPPWEKEKHRLKNAVVGGYGTVPPMEGVFLSSKSFQNLRFGDLRLRSETAKGLFETSSRERRAPWSMARWRVTGLGSGCQVHIVENRGGVELFKMSLCQVTNLKIFI